MYIIIGKKTKKKIVIKVENEKNPNVPDDFVACPSRVEAKQNQKSVRGLYEPATWLETERQYHVDWALLEIPVVMHVLFARPILSMRVNILFIFIIIIIFF